MRTQVHRGIVTGKTQQEVEEVAWGVFLGLDTRKY